MKTSCDVTVDDLGDIKGIKRYMYIGEIEVLEWE